MPAGGQVSGGTDEERAEAYPGRLASLTLIPFRSESYRASPVNNSLATPVLPQVVVPGIAELGWRPMTAAIVLTSGLGIDVTPEGIVAAGGSMAAPVLPSGGVVIQVRGIVGAGGWYLRRFSLTNFRMIQLDLSRFRDVQIEVLRSTLNGASVVVTISNQPCETSFNEPLWYGEEYTAAGTYEVPPGATEIIPELADAGFNWRSASFGPTGVVTIPDAMVIGVERSVKGTNFEVVANPFRAVWRVTL